MGLDWAVISRLITDLIAMPILLFLIYYRRYYDRELIKTAALFNVFVFGVLATLSSVGLSLAAGFGLFAILALFTLRSESFTKIEVSYFFGSVAIAVISATPNTHFGLALFMVMLILLGAYVLDHPKLLDSVSAVKIKLDRIDTYALHDHAKMRRQLTELLDVQVMFYRVISFDYVNDTAKVSVFFKKPK